MGKNNPRSGDPIDRLLQERQQYSVWLSRLDTTADTAPESVLVRIRADYKARLDAVIAELRSHADDVVEQLERDRDTRAELVTREAQAKEIMAEAEVRHAVGEYGDAKWQQIRGEAQKNLVTIREELGELSQEIAELENVQSMIAAPAIPEAPVVPAKPVAPAPLASAIPSGDGSPELSTTIDQAMASPGRPPAPAPQAPARADPPAAPQPVLQPAPSSWHAAAPTPAPEPPKPSQPGPGQSTVRPAATVRPVKPKEGGGTPGRTLWFPSVKEEEVNSGVDELAFLKSVSEDEVGGPSPRRASGGSPRPLEAIPPSTVPPTSNPPASTPMLTTSHTLESAGPTAMPDSSGRPSVQTGARTLKCGECGTMNRPTEWYCERCGAELADL